MNVLLVLPLLLSAPPDNLVRFKARIDAREPLEVGKEFGVNVLLRARPGYSVSDAGMPDPLLQIDVPDCVQLVGKPIEAYRDLARNEFLEEPFERRLALGESGIDFTLTSEPPDGATIGLNLVAYVANEEGDSIRFVRRRLEIELKPRAKGRPAAEPTSNWGRNGTLQIGDRAAPFELPQADGQTVALSEALGKKNIIVTTYRAFW